MTADTKPGQGDKKPTSQGRGDHERSGQTGPKRERKDDKMRYRRG